MKNLLEELKAAFQGDKRLVVDGKLAKNKIVELALAMDKGLLGLLLENENIKKHFFKNVNGTLVFDKIEFQRFVSNKQFLPDSYTAFKNKIGLTTSREYLTESKEVVLVWPYKDCVLEGGQTKEDQKRKEIFWNQTLAPSEIDRLFAPKVLTGFKRYDKDGEHSVEHISSKDNLIIKGNNLLVLHSLKKQYAGRVKLIYIDPPYNTGNDSFGYNDSFNHSTWLTFMKNRLEVARELLRDDGVIFVQCDDNEAAYLKVLMDEIFGKAAYAVTIYVQVRYGQKTLSEKNDYQKLVEQIYVYQRRDFSPIKPTERYSTEKFVWEIIEKSSGEEIVLGGKSTFIFEPGQYEIIRKEASLSRLKETWASGTVLKNNASGKFFDQYIASRVEVDGIGCLYKVKGIGQDGLGHRYFTGPKKAKATKGKFYSGIPLQRLEELKRGEARKDLVIPNFYDFADNFGNCRHEGGVELRSGKKPESLLKLIIELTTKEDDIVLDFFCGTGSTPAVAHKLQRGYIGVEQLDYDKNSTIVRLNNVIQGDTTGISDEVGWKGGGLSYIANSLSTMPISLITLSRPAHRIS